MSSLTSKLYKSSGSTPGAATTGRPPQEAQSRMKETEKQKKDTEGTLVTWMVQMVVYDMTVCVCVCV